MKSDEAHIDAAPVQVEAKDFAPPSPRGRRVKIDLSESDVFCYAMSHRLLIRGVTVSTEVLVQAMS